LPKPPGYNALASISPLTERNSPRGNKESSSVRKKLGKSLSLEALWTPKVVRRTVVKHSVDGCEAILTVPDGTIVARSCYKFNPLRIKDAWINTRKSAPFTRADERVGLFQRMLHHVASCGITPQAYKVFKRTLIVGFQIPICHLRKMVRQVVLSCHNECYKSDDSQPDGTTERCSYMYPSLTGETKSNRKIGVNVPLWTWCGVYSHSYPESNPD